MFKKAVFISVAAATILSASLPNITGTISKVNANGIDEAKLKAITGIKAGDQYSVAALQAAKATIERALKTSGYIDATVNVDAKQVDDGIKVTFDVNKGDTIKIKKVTFVGNKVLSDSVLEDAVVNKKGGLFSWLTGSGKAVPSQLEADAARIRDEYLKRGYLDVQIDKPLMKTDFASKTAEVTYTIRNEGQPYTVGSVSLAPVAGLDNNKLNEDIKLKSGKVFNVDTLRKDLNKLIEDAANKGYAFANAQPRFRKHDDTHTIDVNYVLNPGEKIKINDVKISGNTKTKEHVVRRYVYLAPGDTFNLQDLKDSRDELQRTGYFDSVEIVPKKIGGNSVDLDVNVQEGQTGSIMAGLSYGSYDGLGVSASLSDKNVWGTGIGYSLSLEKSKKSYTYSVSVTDPRVMDSLYSLSVGLYKQKYEFIDYTKKETGGYVSVGRKITREISASVGYIYSDVKYSDYDKPDSNSSYSGDYESYTKSALTASITFDNTDDYLTPRKGYFANVNFEYAGLGKDAKYLKTTFKAAAYYGMQDILNYDLILRAKLRGGYIDDKGNVPRAERLFLGGSTWGIRGFTPASIAPTTTDSQHNVIRLGGYKSLAGSLEASIPLSFVTKGMRLTGFVDYGVIKGYGETEKRGSIGAQIEWKSPIGPVNLIFAKGLNTKSYDRTSKFEFTIGSKF